MLKVINLIYNIVFHPKKIVKKYSLVDYNMRTMKIFIVLILILFYIVRQFTIINKNYVDFQLIIKIILIPIIFVISKNVIIKIYGWIIGSVVGYKIPFNILEATLIPYIAAYVALASLISIINKYNVSNNIIHIVLMIWMNVQVYFIVKYRIQNVNKNSLRNLIAKQIIFIVIIAASSVVYPYLDEQIQIRKNISEEQKLEIRLEVYNVYYEVFNEVKENMEKQRAISNSKRVALRNKMILIVNQVGHLKTNEIELRGYIDDMIDSGIEWYRAKKITI